MISAHERNMINKFKQLQSAKQVLAKAEDISEIIIISNQIDKLQADLDYMDGHPEGE